MKKKFENKTILQSQKSNLVKIMSWQVLDVGVLKPPEGVSAGGPPATRSSCRPGPMSVDLNPRHYSLNKKISTSAKKIILIFIFLSFKR